LFSTQDFDRNLEIPTITAAQKDDIIIK